MKNIDEKVLQRIFDDIVLHFEWVKEYCNPQVLLPDFYRYVVGARYALEVAFSLDCDSSISIADFFEQKINEYFEGDKESE